MSDPVPAVRAFNRFYTGRLGVLGPRFLRTPHSLAEARALYELAQADELEVGELRRRMSIDPGHLSRVLARLERQGLVARERSAAEGRRLRARLTASGADAFATLDRRSAEETAEQLAHLDEPGRRRLVRALAEATRLLGPADAAPAVVIRPPRPGDLGWVVARHATVYVDEYGWDPGFEGLVARIVADYAADSRPARKAAWIAEVDGEPAGCVFCVEEDTATARLRLLLVEPRARGLGLGARLVDECLGFARRAGYARMVLWTNDPLAHARRIYERAGFTLESEHPHDEYGPPMVGQTWTRALRPAAG